jgi:hypothetical protein
LRNWPKESLHVEIGNVDNAHHFDFIVQDQNVSQTYYMEIVEWLREAVSRKMPELWPTDWILHHDNAPTHKALSDKKILAQKFITEKEHPPYFHNLDANDLWPFPKISLL